MATITGLTAARMLAIEAASVIDGNVVAGNLILVKHDGSQINAGNVVGPTGATGATGPQGAAVIPAGIILDFGGSVAPAGYVICDGTGYSTSTYAALFAILGYAYGGSGATFNVPDLRGRVAVGKGTHGDVDVLGDNDGSSLANRSPKHKHTVSDPGHVHTYWTETAVVGGTNGFAYSGGGSDKQPNYAKTGYPGSNNAPPPDTGWGGSPEATGLTVTPGGSPPDHTPAFIVVNKIIKT